ncbi:hypothetical protein RND81_09G137900 [Saponaria officinalis]|uniref:PB1 domain-containing protein n=1 Tax=Saponaria officinalis TaxID=3572 RepID=A0AAW1IKE8_SAPOF
MDTYQPSYSYPDSGGSSPRSREVDFDNAPPPSWEDHPISAGATALPQTYKVKFMVSYGGKIQPRSHDNLLSYIGGETKILAVDRFVKFSTMHTKLATLFNPDAMSSGFTVKYQLPGEDLDALISVTNDDDLEHMMHEYDRMWRGSNKSVKLRLFLFNDLHQQWRNDSGGSAFSSIESDTGKFGGEPDPGPDRSEKFVETLISNQQRQQSDVVLEPPRVVTPPEPLPVHNNVDFLFGLEKGPVHVPGPVPVRGDPIHEAGRFQVPVQELQQFQLREQHHQQQQQQQQSAMYYPKNDENFSDPYQKSSSPANIPAKIQAPAQIPAGYWQQLEHHQPQQPPPLQQHHQQYNPQQPPPQQQQQQPVYMMHAPPQGPPQGNMYHAPMMRGQIPPQIPPNQGYYQPLYSTPAPAPTPTTIPATIPAAPLRPGVAGENTGYQQVMYDTGTGRQVYYAAPPQGGGVLRPPYPGMAVAATGAVSGGEMRSSGDGKSVPKGVPSPTVM